MNRFLFKLPVALTILAEFLRKNILNIALQSREIHKIFRSALRRKKAAHHGEKKKMSFFFTGTVYDFNNQSKQGCKDQESIQSSTTELKTF